MKMIIFKKFITNIIVKNLKKEICAGFFER